MQTSSPSLSSSSPSSARFHLPRTRAVPRRHVTPTQAAAPRPTKSSSYHVETFTKKSGGGHETTSSFCSRRTAWLAAGVIPLACATRKMLHPDTAVASDDVRKFTPYPSNETLSTPGALCVDDCLAPALSSTVTLHRPGDADPHAMVANVADWQLTVPPGVGLSRATLTRGDAEMTGLDVMYTTEVPEGGKIGVAVWPLPRDVEGLEAGPGRLAGHDGVDTFKGVRKAVEGIPLQPGMAPLGEAKILLDAGTLRTVDIKAVSRGGEQLSKKGPEQTPGSKKFYMEYDAPPYVAVAAVPHGGALYVVHATMPGSSITSRREAAKLRDIVDSFRVG